MSSRSPQNPTLSVAILAVDGSFAQARLDRLVVEEPLEIRVAADDDVRTVSVTMRTPGSTPQEDAELALGFLFSEGLLRPGANVVFSRLERHFYTTSACGVCGKSSLQALATTPAEPLRPAAAEPELRIDPQVLHRLPSALRAAQASFSATGGVHAAGLFDISGRLLLIKEDVGRHNAVDKLLGARFAAAAQAKDSLPLHGLILTVSGRASFELVQKARMACVPVFVAVGAPSSLALQLARESGMTLVGFARDGRCNVYSAQERLALLPAQL